MFPDTSLPEPVGYLSNPLKRTMSRLAKFSSSTVDSSVNISQKEEDEDGLYKISPQSLLIGSKCQDVLEYSFTQKSTMFSTPETLDFSIQIRNINQIIPNNGPSEYLSPKLNCPNRQEYLYNHIRAYEIMKGEIPSDLLFLIGPNSSMNNSEENRIMEKLLEKLFPRLKPPINYNRIGKLFKINRSTIRNMYLRWKSSGTFERKTPHNTEEDQQVTERLEKLFPTLKVPVNYNVLGMMFGINRSTIRNMYLRWKRDGTLKFIPAVNYAIPEMIRNYITNLFN